MPKNRIAHLQPDYVFAIVRKPQGWSPQSIDAVPPGAEIISESYVASYAEAHDDLVRCNRLSLMQRLDSWAVILSPGGDL